MPTVHAMDNVLPLGPENAMKRKCLRKSFSIREKVRKASKKASETSEQTLHRQEQNQTHMISINTYHLACAEGSALQCCMFIVVSIASQLCVKQLMLTRIEIYWNCGMGV